MALHPSFPRSPYAELLPDQRWFPADETEQLLDEADGSLSPFRYYYCSDEYEE